jgi:metal-responsive CopG/Arc/MetJ family transcriptional regulator
MAMVRTNVTLPAEVISQIDEIAGPRGRSAYVAEAVQARLKRDRMRKAFDETYGAAVGLSQWKDADEAYRWVRSLREDDPRDDRDWGRDR